MSARRTAALPLALALALAAGCKSTSAKPGPHLAGPAGVALFVGVTARSATEPHPYLAVPNLRGDDLRIIDPVDGAAVLAPTLVLSLSVPTEASPSLVAAGSLNDDGSRLPDLLVVAPTGTSLCRSATDLHGVGRLSGCIQVVQTWAQPDGKIQTAVVNELAIALAEVPGAQDAVVRSLAVLPVTSASGVVVPGKARLAAGLDGGRLLLADFARASGGGGAIAADGTPVVLDLGFDALSLSPAPGGARLYVASTDPLPASTPVYGVAELDVSGPLSATPRWRALDAGGPTTVVLAASVRRFTGFRYTSAAPSSWDPARDLYGAEALRIYAAREAGTCGPTMAVTCGLAVLDPLGGGADGTGGLALETSAAGATADRYQAGIPIPGNVVAMAAIPPPRVGGVCDDGTSAPCDATANPLGTMPYQPYYVGGAWRWASTMAAAVSDDGVVYLLDLGHDGLANGRDWLATNSSGLQAMISAVTWPALTPATTTTAAKLGLALWDTAAGSPATLSRDKTRARALVHATPGFTGSDTWTVAWQGGLPGLTGLDGQAQVNEKGDVQWIAIQTPTGRLDRPFTGVGNLWDAAFAIQAAVPGVRIGDIVRVTAVREPGDGPKPIDASVGVDQAKSEQYCPMGTFELEVEALLPPDPVSYPGGAVKVRQPAVRDFAQPTTAFGATAAGDATRAEATCMKHAAGLLALPAGATALVTKPVNVTFLAGELLLTGLNFGYAGRPTAHAAAGSPYLVQHDATLTGATCPMLDGAALPATCDEACRTACEALLLSRKARRFAYVHSQCATTDTECLARWDAVASTTVNKLSFPNPGGPVLGLDLAWTLDEKTPAVLDLASATSWPARGSLVSVVTAGGQVVDGMTPKVSGVATGTLRPNGVAVWDRPDFTSLTGDHAAVYTSYPANLLMSFWTTSSNTDISLIR